MVYIFILFYIIHPNKEIIMVNQITQIMVGADHTFDKGYELGTQDKHDEFVKVRNKSLRQSKITELAEESSKDLEKFSELLLQDVVAKLYLNGFDDAAFQIIKEYGLE